jgi:hypothetical protein
VADPMVQTNAGISAEGSTSSALATTAFMLT